MAKSRNRPEYKVKKKKQNIHKQKQREMQNAAQAQNEKRPINWTFHKDKETVEIPINAWQMIAQSAHELEAIARFVSVVEQVSHQHQTDGTLMPVYQDDVEPIPGKFGPKGEQQYKLKDSFWNKGVAEKPTIVMADGKTIYDASNPAIVPVTEATDPVDPAK